MTRQKAKPNTVDLALTLPFDTTCTNSVPRSA